MTVKEMADALQLRIFAGENNLGTTIEGGYTSDLLSDVMGHAEANHVWITLQTHKNIIAVASLKELAAIVLVKGFEPDEDTLEAARQENIPLLGINEETFETSGRLFKLIHP